MSPFPLYIRQTLILCGAALCLDKMQIPQALLQFGWPWDSVLAMRCVWKFLGGDSGTSFALGLFSTLLPGMAM